MVSAIDNDKNVEKFKKLQEELQMMDEKKIQNPALQRRTEIFGNDDKPAKQAYDRMYHRHNRG